VKSVVDDKNAAKGHSQPEDYKNIGSTLIEKSDCKACHALNQKSVGPSFYEIAIRYKDRPEMVDSLVNKVIDGGSGVWGQSPMSAHPQLAKKDVGKMVGYILSLKDSIKANSIN
jgi:cytochrome c